jgi:hypothetical protein
MGRMMERDHLEDPILEGRIIVKWIFQKLDGVAWLWLRVGTGVRRL